MEIPVQRSTPALWIERLVIYANVVDKQIIREIIFSRGLNIVRGAAESGIHKEEDNDDYLIGHSVGKSSLCRLIRYALDEDTFAQKEATTQIKSCFENGGIGASVVVNGVKWAVIRKFQSLIASKAAQNVSIEELNDMPANETNYDLYRSFLRTELTQGIPGFHEKTGFKWKDLLAWISRDQEARYEHLWKWRDSRSESRTSQLLKPQAIQMIGCVLGIYSDEANMLISERHELAALRKEKGEQLESTRHRQAIERVKIEEEIGKLFIKHKVQCDTTNEGLYINNAFSGKEDLESKLTTHNSENSIASGRLRDLQFSGSLLTDQINEIANKLLVAYRVTGVSNQSPRIGVRKVELDRLLNEQNRDCPFVHIPLASCHHFSELIDRYQKEFNQFYQEARSKYDDEETEALKERCREWIAERFGLSESLSRVRSEIKKSNTIIEERSRKIEDLSRDIYEVDYLLSLRSSLSVNPAIVDEISQLDINIDEIDKKLAITKQPPQPLSELKGLFADVVSELLFKHNHGKINISKKEPLEFRITGKKGEAVLTLTNVMVDITSMLLAVKGYGRHPQFLIHDSPREADLSGPAYASFLSKVYSLGTQLGGENAPFQYIVTTTTEPPENLNPCVRLTLCGDSEEHMLFKKDFDIIIQRELEFDKEDDVTEDDNNVA
jgi:hypothetical protein